MDGKEFAAYYGAALSSFLALRQIWLDIRNKPDVKVVLRSGSSLAQREVASRLIVQVQNVGRKSIGIDDIIFVVRKDQHLKGFDKLLYKLTYRKYPKPEIDMIPIINAKQFSGKILEPGATIRVALTAKDLLLLRIEKSINGLGVGLVGQYEPITMKKSSWEELLQASENSEVVKNLSQLDQ
ncbi:MAG: hypothetical protein KDE14_04370 [Rhodobacteraceae bacterium]|nr:hypothetical protein [Paracoccaceae bacterium]